jgi:hypothetical protein
MTRSEVSAERLAAAARAQTQLPDGRVSDVRPAWDDRLPGLWGVTVQGRDRRSNAFFRVSDDRVAVPAGLDQAARELSELRPLDGQPWGGGLIYIVTAAGGATPGFPDTWSTEETPLPDGGLRVTATMPEAEVAYAAAGGVGPSPVVSAGGGGVTPPPTMATATLDITADYGLHWRYQLRDEEIDGPAGSPAETPPALPDDQLVAALDGARRRAGAPRAMPAREPRPFESHPDVVVVDLWALGPVYVRIGEADTAGARLSSLDIDWSASPSTLVPLLSAADALPPGILPEDLLSTARVAAGELTASVPAPLATWAAGGAKQLSPRVQGVRTDEEMSRPGRVRVKLDDSLEWALEVDDGGSWRPANGDRP